MTSEDLFELSSLDGLQMKEFEDRYTQIQGQGIEGDLAKIVLRYQNEGKSAN